MASEFERFGADALVERRLRQAREARSELPQGLARPPRRASRRRLRASLGAVSVMAGAGLALLALGSFRAAPPGHDGAAHPTISTTDITRNVGALPFAETADAH